MSSLIGPSYVNDEDNDDPTTISGVKKGGNHTLNGGRPRYND